MAALVRRGAAALRSAGLSARRLVEPPGALGVGSGQFCAAARRPPRAAGAVQVLVRGWATDADRHAVRAAVERSATPLWLSNYTPTPPVQAAPDSQAPTGRLPPPLLPPPFLPPPLPYRTTLQASCFSDPCRPPLRTRRGRDGQLLRSDVIRPWVASTAKERTLLWQQ